MENIEYWKSIMEFPGYEVSDMGQIRSIDRLGADGRRLKGRILKPSSSNGYLGVNLRRDNKSYFVKLYRIVAQYFCEGYTPGLEVNHIDGDKSNNTADNLEWCTHQENINHAQETGLRPKSTKNEEVKQRKEQKEEMVYIAIELLQTTKLTQKQIAKEAGCNHSTISRINSGTRNRKDDLIYPLRMTGKQRGQIARQMLEDKISWPEIQKALGLTSDQVYDIWHYGMVKNAK
jgi:Trp operon repressor